MSIKVTSPDPESLAGTFEVTLSDLRFSGKGTGLNIYDALYSAECRLEAENKANEVQTVVITENTEFVKTPKVSIDASSIRI